VKKEEDKEIMINTQSNYQLSEDDSLLKSLEFTPPDYNTLQKLLRDHIEKKGEGLGFNEEEPISQDKEEQKQGEKKDLQTVCKEHITANKITEQYSKAIDRLVHLTDEPESFVKIETPLFSKILRIVEGLKLKHKNFTNFIQKSLSDHCSKAIKNLRKALKDEHSVSGS
jgi:hypothetical protein